MPISSADEPRRDIIFCAFTVCKPSAWSHIAGPGCGRLIVDEELLILDADGRRQTFDGQCGLDHRLHGFRDPCR